jgi:hypothetical protein
MPKESCKIAYEDFSYFQLVQLLSLRQSLHRRLYYTLHYIRSTLLQFLLLVALPIFVHELACFSFHFYFILIRFYLFFRDQFLSHQSQFPNFFLIVSYIRFCSNQQLWYILAKVCHLGQPLKFSFIQTIK